MSTISLRIASSGVTNPFTSDAPAPSLQDFITILRKHIGGANKYAATFSAKSALVAATGTITIASGTGGIDAVINGVTISVTWATSDTNTATLLKNAINASVNALVANHVTATSLAGVVTITAVSPGIVGNTITLAAAGTGATASGARLTGGTETRYSYTF